MFFSAAGDEGPELLAADLSEESPKPRSLSWLPGTRPATTLFYEATGQRLFAAQAESGDLWRIDPSSPDPRVHLVAEDLGWPLALGFSKQTQSLYVTDAKNQRLWSLDCRGRCKDPTVFLQSKSLENPTTLAVALDGTIWLGDLKTQTLQTIRPDGSVARTIHTLSGASAPVEVQREEEVFVPDIPPR